MEDFEDCRSELDAMQKELPIDAYRQNLQNVQVVKSLSKKWKRGMFKSLIKGAVITLAGSIWSIGRWFTMELQLTKSPCRNPPNMLYSFEERQMFLA